MLLSHIVYFNYLSNHWMGRWIFALLPGYHPYAGFFFQLLSALLPLRMPHCYYSGTLPSCFPMMKPKVLSFHVFLFLINYPPLSSQETANERILICLCLFMPKMYLILFLVISISDWQSFRSFSRLFQVFIKCIDLSKNSHILYFQRIFNIS